MEIQTSCLIIMISERETSQKNIERDLQHNLPSVGGSVCVRPQCGLHHKRRPIKHLWRLISQGNDGGVEKPLRLERPGPHLVQEKQLILKKNDLQF